MRTQVCTVTKTKTAAIYSGSPGEWDAATWDDESGVSLTELYFPG